MSILPMLGATVIIRALLRAGFLVLRQRGSHVFLRHKFDPARYATVPKHSRDISRKDLASILRQSKISVEEFLRLLGKNK
ncbi:MAG: type II toxin-antitoxin system HicA family toxin [Parcubacteria group bacterium]|nr:type II toxin-antitoxin system HicA family toxin [Parcubacteria group bacterium]